MKISQFPDTDPFVAPEILHLLLISMVQVSSSHNRNNGRECSKQKEVHTFD